MANRPISDEELAILGDIIAEDEAKSNQEIGADSRGIEEEDLFGILPTTGEGKPLPDKIENLVKNFAVPLGVGAGVRFAQKGLGKLLGKAAGKGVEEATEAAAKSKSPIREIPAKVPEKAPDKLADSVDLEISRRKPFAKMSEKAPDMLESSADLAISRRKPFAKTGVVDAEFEIIPDVSNVLTGKSTPKLPQGKGPSLSREALDPDYGNVAKKIAGDVQKKATEAAEKAGGKDSLVAKGIETQKSGRGKIQKIVTDAGETAPAKKSDMSRATQRINAQTIKGADANTEAIRRNLKAMGFSDDIIEGILKSGKK